MSRLLFFNLPIDQNWNPSPLLKNLFPVRVPSSERLVRGNEDLSVFVSQPEDLCCTYSDFSAAFRSYLNSFFPLPTLQPLRSHPYDLIEWKEEVKALLQIGPHPKAFSGVGLSENEEFLLGQLNAPSSFGSFKQDDFIAWNKKSFLYHWCKAHQIPFPETQLLTELSALPRDPSAMDYLLKSDFGSGGGGNISSSLLTPPFFQHLLKLSHPTSQQWLWQKSYPRKLDFSVLGAIDEESGPLKKREFSLLKVDYDSRGLSWAHEPLHPNQNPNLWSQISSVYDQLASELLRGGYQGAFGFDGFITTDHQVFPIIDLNVRWTKGHLIERAAKRLKQENWRSLRLRWPRTKPLSFEILWSQLQKKLKMDFQGRTPSGLTCNPYVMGSLASRHPKEELLGPGELSVFCGCPLGSKESLDSWCQEVEQCLRGIIDENTMG